MSNHKPIDGEFWMYVRRHLAKRDLSIYDDTIAGNYPKDWETIAAYIKHLANGHCEHCGSRTTLDTATQHSVMHLDKGRSNCHYTNLVALCDTCMMYLCALPLPIGVYSFDDEFIPAWAKKRGLVSPESSTS